MASFKLLGMTLSNYFQNLKSCCCRLAFWAAVSVCASQNSCVSLLSFQLTKVEPKSLLWDFSDPVESPEKLSAYAVKSDLIVLIDTLKKAYAGWKRHDPDLLASVEARLKSFEITDEKHLSAEEFCVKIQILFQEIPDALLSIRQHLNKPCGVKPRIAMVGKNSLNDKNTNWKVSRLVRNKHNVLLVSLREMEAAPRVSGRGLGQALEESLVGSEMVIVDVRGAEGESTEEALKLAQILLGQRPQLPISHFIRIQSAQALALRINFLNSTRVPKFSKSEISKNLDFQLAELKREFNKARNGELGSELISDFNAASEAVPEKMFSGPVVVLIDSACKRGCEKAVELLRTHPQHLLVGENTFGNVQFGGEGLLVLPESRLLVSIPTHFYEYADQRLSEKVGIEPDWAVSPGQDAPQYALEKLLP